MKIKKQHWLKYGIFLLLLVCIILLHTKALLLLFALIILSVLMLSVDHFRYIKTYAAIAVFGTVAEMIVITTSSAWTYQNPVMFGVPLWTLPMWGIAGLCFITLAEIFRENKVEF